MAQRMYKIDYSLPDGVIASNRAHSYLRVSSGRQLKGDGIRRQKDYAKAYCDRHSLELVDTYEDLGVSGYTGANRGRRGALKRVLDAVKDGKIKPGEHLVVENLDRLGRDKITKAFRVFSEILEAGVIIHTIGDGAVYTEKSVNENMGELFASLGYMLRGHNESATKAFRQRGTWERKRENASINKMTRRAPAWLIPKSDDNGKIFFEKHSVRVGIVIRIFEELANGIGRDKIARRLNAEVREARENGRDTSDLGPWGHGGTWRGREWHGGTVQKITDSRAVLGEFQPGKTIFVNEGDEVRIKRVRDGAVIPDYYPRIVSDELWLRARSSADSRKQTKVMNAGGRRGTVYSNLFSGFARCIMCGSPMNYRDRGPRSTVILRCSGNRNGTCENDHRYPYKPLEAAVLEWVQELDVSDTSSEEANELEAEISSRIIKRDRLLEEADALVRDFQGKSRTAMKRILECEAEADVIEAELAKLQKQLDGMKGRISPTDRAAEIAALRDRMSKAAGADLFEIRAGIAQALRGIVQKLVFHRNGNVSVVLGGGKQYVFADGQIHYVVDWSQEHSSIARWVPDGSDAPKHRVNIPADFEAIHQSVMQQLGDE